MDLHSDRHAGRVIQLDELRGARRGSGAPEHRPDRTSKPSSGSGPRRDPGISGEPVDFQSNLHAGALNNLEALRVAQRDLDTRRQLDGALELLERLGAPRTSTDAMEVADALNFAVDAHCNMGQTAEACALAADKIELIYDLDPNRRHRLGRGPRTLPAVYAARVHAHAIELNGDPDDAIRRLLALHMTLSKKPQIGAGPVDSLLILRCLLSSARRDGGATARKYADMARREGDAILARLEITGPRVAAAVASYCHRAAVERRAREGASARREAIELFEHSLPLRPDTPRDRRSRGMAVGDLHVLRGDRKTGARILTETVEGFEHVLPRHYESARVQLIERELLLAA